MFDALRLKIPASFDAVLPADAVAEKIASLNAIRGGWVAHALGVSKSIDDEDDVEDDAEDDDEVLHALYCFRCFVKSKFIGCRSHDG